MLGNNLRYKSAKAKTHGKSRNTRMLGTKRKGKMGWKCGGQTQDRLKTIFRLLALYDPNWQSHTSFIIMATTSTNDL